MRSPPLVSFGPSGLIGTLRAPRPAVNGSYPRISGEPLDLSTTRPQPRCPNAPIRSRFARGWVERIDLAVEAGQDEATADQLCGGSRHPNAPPARRPCHRVPGRTFRSRLDEDVSEPRRAEQPMIGVAERCSQRERAGHGIQSERVEAVGHDQEALGVPVDGRAAIRPKIRRCEPRGPGPRGPVEAAARPTRRASGLAVLTCAAEMRAELLFTSGRSSQGITCSAGSWARPAPSGANRSRNSDES
jgi:hypothetical protein